MWDPFVLRATPPSGAPLEVVAESASDVRLMGGFDTLPWNGRQIARDAAGNWFVLTERGGSVFLATGPGQAENPYRPRGGDLPAFELVGGGKGALFHAEGGASRASMAVSADEHLHLIFHRPDGLWHLKARLDADSPARLQDKAAWTVPARLVEGACRAGDIMRDAAGAVAVCYAQNDTVYYRPLSAEQPEVVAGRNTGLPALRQFATPGTRQEDDAAAEGLGAALQRTLGKIPLSECESQDAVMDLAPDGAVWLAFRRDFGIWVSQRSADGQWSPPELVVREYAFHPSIIVADGQPLLTYHHDGLRRHPLDIGTDLRRRAGGAPALGYATLTADGWRNGTLSAPEEIAVHRRGMWAQRGSGRLLTQIEQLGWPVLFRDPRGVVWAFWQNTTRRWSFTARWLGNGFDEARECRGPFNAPRLPVNAEKLPPPGANDTGLLLHAAAAGGDNRVIFDRLRIPTLATTDEREVLFLDNLEVAQTSGAEWVLNTMTKPIQEPALSPNEGERVAQAISVRKRGDTYVMGYRTSYESNEGEGLRWAISRDGLRFQKVDQLPGGLPEPEPSTSRALDYWKGAAELRPPSRFPNPDSSDPARKFLRLGFSTDARGSYWLEHSPDGRQWVKDQQLTAPEAMRERAQPDTFDATDPERPIRNYGRVYTETGRSWGVIWTRDLTHWSGLEHLLDPDEPYTKGSEMSAIGSTGKDYTMRGQIFIDSVAGKGEEEIYAAGARRAEGLYFCFYWPGTQGRPLTDVGIAVSRDGFNFARVKNGERILPLGPPGAWDSGLIFQMNPMLDGDNVRVFYRATAGRREGSGSFEHNLTEIGVAMIRINGFTFYRPCAADQPATVTTIPIHSPAGASRKLVVNLEGLTSPAASFVVEVLDAATGQPINGFAAADCLPPNGDGLAAPVAWKNNAGLPAGRDIRLRFHLRGQGLRFYSFGFR